MYGRPTNKASGEAQNSASSNSSALARALLIAVLCSQLSTVSASPISSLPASAPGFHAGSVSAVKETLGHPRIETTHVNPIPPPVDIKLDEDEDWDLEYEDVAHEDQMMDVHGMGNAIDKVVDSNSG
jgi:hypothetical protein